MSLVKIVSLTKVHSRNSPDRFFQIMSLVKIASLSKAHSTNSRHRICQIMSLVKIVSLSKVHSTNSRHRIVQNVSLSTGVAGRKRCVQTTAGVMEVAVGQLCFSEFPTGPTGNRFAEIWPPHCGGLQISREARFSEAAVRSNNRRGQWISVSEKHCFLENCFFCLEANTNKSTKKTRFIRAATAPV